MPQPDPIHIKIATCRRDDLDRRARRNGHNITWNISAGATKPGHIYGFTGTCDRCGALSTADGPFGGFPDGAFSHREDGPQLGERCPGRRPQGRISHDLLISLT